LSVEEPTVNDAITLSTTDQIAGKRIVRTIGLVRGNTIRARHIGRDFMASLKNVVGGEITEYTKMIAECREEALDRMIAQAQANGANAVVGVRFASAEMMDRAAELLAYGTAVVIEDIP
jgi:uncharacterized protein YbjQ (UPF0145 family)